MGILAHGTVIMAVVVALICGAGIVLIAGEPKKKIASGMLCLVLVICVSNIKDMFNIELEFETYDSENNRTTVSVSEYIKENDYIFVSELGYIKILVINDSQVIAEKGADVTYNLLGRVALSQDLKCPVGYVDSVIENRVFINKYIDRP